MKHKIGILGAGTWGMALARMLTVSGNDVTVWSALEQEIDNLSTTRVHPNLPGMTIPAEMKFTKSVEEVCTDKEILLFAVPSVFVRSTAAKARPFVPDGQIIVDVAKGIEKDTLFTMTEILADELGKEGGPKGVRLVALSGPTHAEEVAIDLPTTIVSASKDMEAARFVQTVFTNNVMRVYTNEDIKELNPDAQILIIGATNPVPLLPSWSEYFSKLNNYEKQLADVYGATYVSIPFAQTELDGHPTVSGHKYIADKIVKAIEAQQ